LTRNLALLAGFHMIYIYFSVGASFFDHPVTFQDDMVQWFQRNICSKPLAFEYEIRSRLNRHILNCHIF